VKSINSEEESKSIFDKEFTLFSGVQQKDLVMASKQLAVLFEAQISSLKVFQLMAGQVESKALSKIFREVGDRIQGGESVSKAMSHYEDAFSPFFVAMVASGDETARLDKTFAYLADYIERNYAITSKAKSALVYPAFVIVIFIGVMVLMLTMVIPKVTGMLTETGAEIPTYTAIVMALSDFVVHYGVFFFLVLVLGGFFLIKYIHTPSGREAFDDFKIKVPAVGTLYKRLFLSRIADNMSTMLGSGIKMVRAIEITRDVVDNKIYSQILDHVLEDVKNGVSVADAMAKHEEIPPIMSGMIKIGEDTANVSKILDTLANFYRREVENAVKSLVDLIEPIMIVGLGLGVGVLMASVLIPIYNISTSLG
jgi:type IV pilus assembly protein PilC